MPLYPWFGLLALCCARPLDQNDPVMLYASIGAIIAVALGILSWRFEGRKHRILRVMATGGIYISLVTLSNSFWIAVVAIPITLVNLIWIFRREAFRDTHARHVSLAASLLVLLLLPCFAIQQVLHRQHNAFAATGDIESQVTHPVPFHRYHQ